jgi:hypothetical protein
MRIPAKVGGICFVLRNEIYSALAVWRGTVGPVSDRTADLHCAQTHRYAICKAGWDGYELSPLASTDIAR